MASRRPKRTVGNHRNYDLIELQTLRDALAQTGNISSAVALARQRQQAPVGDDSLLAPSRASTRPPPTARSRKASRVRPLERTVEELLLPAVDRLAADPDREPPSSSSPPAGRPAGCTAPAASPPPPRARPGSS